MAIWLRSPVFTYGQLYVASSRTGDPDALKFAVMQQPGEPLSATANVVFKEVLLTDSVTETQFDDQMEHNEANDLCAEFDHDEDVLWDEVMEYDEAPASQPGSQARPH